MPLVVNGHSLNQDLVSSFDMDIFVPLATHMPHELMMVSIRDVWES